MMTGTDGGSMAAPGLTLRQKFAELAKAGFSPLKILQMTTINPAQYLGRETPWVPSSLGATPTWWYWTPIRSTTSKTSIGSTPWSERARITRPRSWQHSRSA
jgi:amidohydrolase family protein